MATSSILKEMFYGLVASVGDNFFFHSCIGQNRFEKYIKARVKARVKARATITHKEIRMSLPVNIKLLLEQRNVESTRIEYKTDWNPEAVLHSSIKATVSVFSSANHNHSSYAQ